MSRTNPAEVISDGVADVHVSAPESIGHGFRPYERYHLELERRDDGPLSQQRDILRGGRVVGVLPIDVARRQIVLLRQFRLAAHFATGRGDMIEIVAGRVDPGESDTEAALRECREEIGVAPQGLVPLYGLLPTPGLTDEFVTSYAGFIDASRVAAHGGLAEETEHIETLVVSIDDALAALEGGRLANALAVTALQWLALNRARLDDIFALAQASR